MSNSSNANLVKCKSMPNRASPVDNTINIGAMNKFMMPPVGKELSNIYLIKVQIYDRTNSTKGKYNDLLFTK